VTDRANDADKVTLSGKDPSGAPYAAPEVPREFNWPLHGSRGVAALVVVLFHVFGLLGLKSVSGFLNGSGAVAFFYVLSGLVVGLSIQGASLQPVWYARYMIRRGFRLLPLLVFTATLGGLYLWYVDSVMPLSVAYNGEMLTAPQFVAGLVGYSLKPNGPSWSIFVELVGSAVLPFMMLAGRSLITALAAGSAVLVFSMIPMGMQHHWNFYTINFFCGLSIIWAFPLLHVRLKTWSLGSIRLMAAGFLVAAYLARIVTGPWRFGEPGINAVETAFVTPLVMLMFVRPDAFGFLERRPFRVLGDLSFSIYLTHWLLLAASLNIAVLLYPAWSGNLAVFAPVYICFYILLVLAVSALTYNYVERTGIAMGKWVLSKAPVRRRAAVS
jgi:peptidoglycan/LPS O-acetylase OafA/YrhL